eukprot:scaffold9207_cov84-Cyclotella_meneghiniana.AAC.7
MGWAVTGGPWFTGITVKELGDIKKCILTLVGQGAGADVTGVAVGSAEMGWAVTGGPWFTGITVKELGDIKKCILTLVGQGAGADVAGIAVLAMGLEDGDAVEIKGLADGDEDTDAVGLELGVLNGGFVGDVGVSDGFVDGDDVPVVGVLLIEGEIELIGDKLGVVVGAETGAIVGALVMTSKSAILNNRYKCRVCVCKDDICTFNTSQSNSHE